MISFLHTLRLVERQECFPFIRHRGYGEGSGSSLWSTVGSGEMPHSFIVDTRSLTFSLARSPYDLHSLRIVSLRRSGSTGFLNRTFSSPSRRLRLITWSLS